MCELTHGMAGERHGNGMGAAWSRNAMCESALNMLLRTLSVLLLPSVKYQVLCTFKTFKIMVMNILDIRRGRQNIAKRTAAITLRI